MKNQIEARMKEQYEHRYRFFLTRRCPTIIRLDGKAFHTYTKGLNKPFDEGLITDMQETTKYLCENIQGCQLGYTQSDEISLLITDYDTVNTEAWFNYNLQKMCSISASLATAKFGELRFARRLHEWRVGEDDTLSFPQLAMFDSRVFQIADKEEVVNYFISRQRDAERNSIQMLAQSLYSHKELHKKNTSELQEMCFQKGANWNDLGFSKKRGSLVLKNTYWNNELVCEARGTLETDTYEMQDGVGVIYYKIENKVLENPIIRNKWEVVDTPIFTVNRKIIFNKL